MTDAQEDVLKQGSTYLVKQSDGNWIQYWRTLRYQIADPVRERDHRDVVYHTRPEAPEGQYYEWIEDALRAIAGKPLIIKEVHIWLCSLTHQEGKP